MSERETSVNSPALAVGDCPATSSLLPIMVSVASLIGCLYVIVTYLYVPALRQHPAGIMFGMSVYGAVYQFLYLLDQSSDSLQCSQMGVIVDFFLTGQETYMLIFAIDLLLALKNPFSASKGQMKKYHIYGGLWSLSCAVISHFDTPYALFGFCWMSSNDDHLNMPQNKQNGGALTSGIFFALYIVGVYCTSLIAIVRTWGTFLKGLRNTFRTRQRIQRHLKYYVGCYFGYWTLVLACYALFSILPQSSNTSTTESSTDSGLRCRVWRLLSCLLLSKGMVNSIIWTRTSNILKIIEQLREFGYVDLPTHEDSINWALRLEIVTNTTRGICDSVDKAEREARASANASQCSVDDNSSGGNGSSSDQSIDYCDRKESYTEIARIIFETRHDGGLRGPSSEGVVFYDYAPHVFRHLRMAAKISPSSYRHSIQQTTKERVSEGKSGAFFYFTEDRKYVVKTLKSEELNFLLSILPTYYTYIKNNPDTFVTRFFGCHGLTMYGKTVHFVVMQSVFDTNLQIHERFDLKGSWVGRLEGRKPTGTVAICKYCSSEYTVGGSHDQLCDVRRGEGNLRHQYDQVGKDLNWNRHMALPWPTARSVALQLTKDSNFLSKINCIDYSLLVGIHHRSFNVSHYSSAETIELPSRASSATSSFLVDQSSRSGNTSNRISRSRSRSSSGGSQSENPHMGAHPFMPPYHKPFHQAIHGGMSVDEVHGPGIYFMGLIDILQQWNFRKRVEHFVRVYILMQDKHGISVVNPKQYAERFQQRVIRELIYDGLAEMDELAVLQTQLQDQHNMQLFDSGRTLSTLLNSFDVGADHHQQHHSVTMDRRNNNSSILSPRGGASPSQSQLPYHYQGLPRPSSLPGIPARRRAATTTTPTAGADPYAYQNNASERVGRLSGGLVMEPPGLRSSLPMVVYPLPHTSSTGSMGYNVSSPYGTYSHYEVLPPQIRRLAPLSSSPRVSSSSSVGRSESSDVSASVSLNAANNHSMATIVLPSSIHSNSNNSSFLSNSSNNSSATSTNNMSIETAATPHESSHGYRIVRTPTILSSAAALSA